MRVPGIVIGIGCALSLVIGGLVGDRAGAQDADNGKTLFVKNCAPCHGPSGKGDGPAAAALKPKPRDLTDKTYMTDLKDDYLFTLIQKGGAAVGKSPLIPAFGSTMKEGDIKDVIAFIRAISK